MRKYFSVFNQNFSWHVLALIVIIGVGIFLRTYHFHDWLRFNADQSRDATVVSDVINGKESLPLLGPKAGGTNFRVGPAFYYFQIIGAKVFGNYPDKLAYLDLFFSILTIPLLFLFLRKYFDVKTALVLTAIFAVSFYAVKYSRFAWNPNALPFWSILFLYSLHEIMIAGEKAGKRWLALTGAALGIGIQLHTLSLVLFPIMTLSVFGYLLYRREKNTWQIIFAVCFIALLLNAPQIASEIQTGGENTAAFFSGIGTKEKKGSGLATNTVKNMICFSQSSAYILSSYDSSDTCESKSIMQRWNILAFMFGLIIFGGGMALTIRFFRKEEEVGKKYFLGIFALYLIFSFLIFLPLANEISMRFFLVIAFMPFILLGLWYKYLLELFPKIGSYGIWGISLILVAVNLFSVKNSFTLYQAYLTNSDAGMDNVLLKEVELSSAFIVSHAIGAPVVSVDGDAQYLFKALKSMQYFTSKTGIKLVQKNKKTDPLIPAFIIENSKQKNKILGRSIDSLPFGRFTIFLVR